MLFDSGIVFICELQNVAENGYMAKEELVIKGKYWFGERTVGYNRQYLAKGVDEQVDMLIRIHRCKHARIGMYAVLGNGEQFRITNVAQIVDDINSLKYTDLTLQRLNKNYEIQYAEQTS